MSETITEAGPETRVNPIVEDDQLDPAITALTGGNYAVVYRTWDTVLSRYVIDIALHEPDGTQIASGLNGFTDYTLAEPDVAATEDGGFLVAFVAAEGEPGLYVAKYDAAGVLLGDDLAVERDAVNAQDNVDQPSIIAISGGGFAIP